MRKDTNIKSISRRNFVRNNALVAARLSIVPPHVALLGSLEPAATFTRDLNIDLLVNHCGFVPSSSKFCVAKSMVQKEFQVVNAITQEIQVEGELQPMSGNFGDFLIGDFSSLNKAGRYFLRSDNARSYPFFISTTVYQPAIELIIHYFSLQRCGANSTGYLSPCHLDDGLRTDNGEHQDATGGWHDACDLRKWVNSTIYGMLGLARIYHLQDEKTNESNVLLCDAL
jgi:hypothetical protein